MRFGGQIVSGRHGQGRKATSVFCLNGENRETVQVAPLGIGQQATQLSFTAAITLDRDLPSAQVQAFVRTPALRCMGGGAAGVAFQKGREQAVTPGSMSNGGIPAASSAQPCARSRATR